MSEAAAGGPTRQTLVTLLKSEIERHARRISREENAALRDAVTRYRHDIAALKRDVVALQRGTSGLKKALGKTATTLPATEDAAPSRFSPKWLAAHRSMLGLSAEHYGKLAGASGLSIYKWEAGKAAPRASGRAALAQIRGLGKREALARLVEMGVEIGTRSGRRQRAESPAKKTTRHRGK